MPDRDKVINRMKTICNICKENKWRTEFSSDTIYPLLRDVLALLKEQEPIWNDVLNVWTCPSCGQMVSTNYCRDCGKKVKWE